jgi:methionyl-tRNA formyltransferase
MAGPPMRIVLFSNLAPFASRFEQVVKTFGHQPAGIVTTPGPATNRSSSYIDIVQVTRPGIDVVVSNHPGRWAQMIEPMRPDLILSMGFPWLIPEDVLAVPPLGAINIHASSLPKYRGPHPIGWAFRNGDSELGLTIHRIDSTFDTGHILAAGTVPLTDQDDFSTIGDLYSKLLFGLLGASLERAARGEPGEPQAEEGVSYAPFFEPEWRVVDWSSPARTIHNQVRSWTGDRGIPKGALATINGQDICITRTRLVDGGTSSGQPGTVIARDATVIRVQCGDMPVDVIEHTTEH